MVKIDRSVKEEPQGTFKKPIVDISQLLKRPGTSLEEKGISMIVYADPGVGKTSLIKTLLGWEYGKGFINEPYCKPEEIFVVDVEAGDLVLAEKNKRLVTSVRVEEETLQEFTAMVDYLATEHHKFKFVFVDNMSELEKYFLVRLTMNKDLSVPRQKEWGDTSFWMRKYIRALRNLTFKGMNVIFNFWAMTVPIEDKDGHQSSYVAPMVMRSTTMEYIGLVDHTAYMGIGTQSDPQGRYLQFESNKLIKCKTRHESIKQFESPDLARIFRLLKGEGGENG